MSDKKEKVFSLVQLIEIRKRKWNRSKNLLEDIEYTEKLAEYVLNNRKLALDIKKQPYLMIELFGYIVDKHQKQVPFFLNDVQVEFLDIYLTQKKLFEQGKLLSLKFIILKGRQQGFTSLITALQLCYAVGSRNFRGFTLTDSADNSDDIFLHKAKYMYDRFPSLFKPSEKYNSKKELYFDRINSQWKTATAGNKDVGRSKTLNFFHGSEIGMWTNTANILAGLGSALTNDAVVILESTAKGYNYFKDLWDNENNYNKLFFEWWKTSEYKQRFIDKRGRKDFVKLLSHERMKTENAKTKDWAINRCRWLLNEKKLQLEAVYWYYNQWLDKRDKMKEEYPCYAEEAFIASGNSVFDNDSLAIYRDRLKEKYSEELPLQGYFDMRYRNTETKDKILDDTIRFIEATNGYIIIYEEPKKDTLYVIGGDTAGDGSDFFTATVMNNMTGKRVATLHAQLEPDDYAHQMYCLGKYYNYALQGIEINFDLYPVKELQRLGYANQYKRQVYDSKTNKKQEKYGWRTDKTTRPMMVSCMIIETKRHLDRYTDVATLGEAMTFIYNEKRKPDAAPGKHDDLLISDMIAMMIRPQQNNVVYFASEQDLSNYYGTELEDLKKRTGNNSGFIYNPGNSTNVNVQLI